MTEEITTSETKRCPFCDEEIRLKALVCKHCRQWMPGYTYESAIRDLIIDKQVTEIQASTIKEDLETREGQLELALKWAVSDRSLSLKGFDLAARDLRGIDFSGADLQEANLSESDLSGAKLNEANLTKTNLFRANLKGAKLRKARLKETYLREANLEQADLSGSSLLQADLRGTAMREANLYRVDLDSANLRTADLRQANMRDCYLKETNLMATKMEGVQLNGALLIRANFTDSDVTEFQYKRARSIEEIITPSGRVYTKVDQA